MGPVAVVAAQVLFPVLALAGLLVCNAAAAAPQLPPLPLPPFVHAHPPLFTLAHPHLQSLTLIHCSPSFAFAHLCLPFKFAVGVCPPLFVLAAVAAGFVLPLTHSCLFVPAQLCTFVSFGLHLCSFMPTQLFAHLACVWPPFALIVPACPAYLSVSNIWLVHT